VPELPEVEMQRRYLTETSLHKKIKTATILDTDVIRDVSSREFTSGLELTRACHVRSFCKRK